jgi:glutamate racemase
MSDCVAIFDAGLGSYLIVDKLRSKHPQVDFLYLADRASFPYGTKTLAELKVCVYSAIRFLEKFKPQLIIVASNVPSVTLLSSLTPLFKTPILGIYPPIQSALKHSITGNIGILGVKAMTESAAIQNYISAQAPLESDIKCFNVSPLVELVESGRFLSDEVGTRKAILHSIDNILNQYPMIDTFTLSSTHLPWLNSYFEHAYPSISFIDPANDIISSISKLKQGNGILRTMVTVGVDKAFSISDFKSTLDALNLNLVPEVVTIEQVFTPSHDNYSA